jgi:hypothetical protein
VFRPCKEVDCDEILLEVWKINIEREREGTGGINIQQMIFSFIVL